MACLAALKFQEMGKVATAVSIDGAMSKNVFPPFTKLKSVLPVRGELKTSSSQF